VQEAGKEPRAEVGAVGLIEETAPEVGVKAVGAFAEGGMGVDAFGADGGD